MILMMKKINPKTLKKNVIDKIVEEFDKTKDIDLHDNDNDIVHDNDNDIELELETENIVTNEDLETVVELESTINVKTIDINDIDETEKDNELIVTKEPNQENLEENKIDVDLNTKNVKELKKLVTASGGKVSSLKTKDELIEYLKIMNNLFSHK